VPIPILDNRGLLPVGVHACKFSDIEQAFLNSQYRVELYENVKSFIDGPLRNVADGLQLFLGGSFFSDKLHPADIEATVYLPCYPVDRFQNVMGLFAQHDYYKQQNLVDFYPSIQMPGQNDFVQFFQYVGPTTASVKGLDEKAGRGVLEVIEWELG